MCYVIPMIMYINHFRPNLKPSYTIKLYQFDIIAVPHFTVKIFYCITAYGFTFKDILHKPNIITYLFTKRSEIRMIYLNVYKEKAVI